MNISYEQLIKQIKNFIPKLNKIKYKGECGKIGIIGGCFEYTGAPYYSAISSLKCGADLTHIFCTESAGIPIKCYSPEIIVHPLLKTELEIQKYQNKEEIENNIIESITNWLKNFHVLIIGPGLGRDPLVMKCTKKIIENVKEIKLPLIIDGDGLFLILNNLDIIYGYPLAILTPNNVEYNRFLDKLKLKEENSLKNLCTSLGNITIVRKGQIDYINNGTDIILEVNELGGPRRSGGQGDLLTGLIGTFLAWSHQYYSTIKEKYVIINNQEIPYTMLASYAGCIISKRCNKEAFKKHFRSTTTPNMIDEIGKVFEKLFPCDYPLD